MPNSRRFISRALLPLSAISILLLGAACAGQHEAPELASSSSSVVYAAEWSERLKQASARYESRRDEVRADLEGFAGSPDQLEDPDWAGVARIVEQADLDGRSQAMAEALRNERQMDGFIERHGKELGWRVGAQVSSVLEKRGCTCGDEASRAASYAVREGFRRQLESRRHDASEAYRLLDREVQGPSKRNAQALEEQVDTITSASFFVFVEAYDLRDEIDILLADQRRVARTLDREIEADRSELATLEGSRDRASRSQAQATQERLEILEGARAPLEEASQRARELRAGMDEELAALRDAYRSALEGLISDLESRSS